MAGLERRAYQLGLRPWELDRFSPGELIAWLAAHGPPPAPRNDIGRADDVMRHWAKAAGWEMDGERR